MDLVYTYIYSYLINFESTISVVCGMYHNAITVLKSPDTTHVLWNHFIARSTLEGSCKVGKVTQHPRKSNAAGTVRVLDCVPQTGGCSRLAPQLQYKGLIIAPPSSVRVYVHCQRTGRTIVPPCSSRIRAAWPPSRKFSSTSCMPWMPLGFRHCPLYSLPRSAPR